MLPVVEKFISSSEVNTVNIATVDEMSQSRPDEAHIFEPTGNDVEKQESYRRWTYRELEEASNEIAAGLLELGFKKGDRTALMVTPSSSSSSTFGLFKAGVVPVMVDPGIGIKDRACLESAAPQGFIGIGGTHPPSLGGNAERLKQITAGSRLFGRFFLKQLRALGRKSEHLKLAATEGDDIAAILFTLQHRTTKGRRLPTPTLRCSG